MYFHSPGLLTRRHHKLQEDVEQENGSVRYTPTAYVIEGNPAPIRSKRDLEKLQETPPPKVVLGLSLNSQPSPLGPPTISSRLLGRQDSLLTESDLLITIAGVGVQTVPVYLPGAGVTSLEEQALSTTSAPAAPASSSSSSLSPSTFARPVSPTHTDNPPSTSSSSQVSTTTTSTHSSSRSSSSSSDAPSTSVPQSTSTTSTLGTVISFSPTPTQPPPTVTSKAISHTGSIVGGIIGSLACVSLVAVLFLLCKRTRYRKYVHTSPLMNKFRRIRTRRSATNHDEELGEDGPVLHITEEALHGDDDRSISTQISSPISPVPSFAPHMWKPTRLARYFRSDTDIPPQPTPLQIPPLSPRPSSRIVSGSSFPPEKTLPLTPDPEGADESRPIPDIPHSPTASSMFPLSEGLATNMTEISTLCVQMAALEREVARLREQQEVQLHTSPIEPPPGYGEL